MINLKVNFDLEADKKRLYGVLKYLKGVQEVTIKKFRNKRSLKENNYYWGVVVNTLANEFGYFPEEMHQVLGRMFLQYEKPNRITGEVELLAKSTTELTTLEAEEYYEKIRIWALSEYSIFIPLPNQII
jgi:hypothetical protein